ncbi:MAG TPA: NUDIX domain-containing protein [Mycobacteriales bacterium]|nr:NUDIX domain-containing protein [Mycobacteriales bacterium]
MISADGQPQPADAVICAGAVIKDDAGRILLVRRAHQPAIDTWTVPGGRVERGETPAEAAAREVHEETGLVVEIGELIATVPVMGFLVHDFAATVTGGELAPGDDAADAQWYAPADLDALELSPGLIDALRAMGVL